jgi:hypothetical protein
MNLLSRTVGRYPLGAWIAVVAVLLLFLGWGMQAYSLINWDSAVDLGLQNERFSGGPAESAWAKESWGVAVADLVWPLPLGVVALVGIFRKRLYGLIAGSMELAIGVYFPLFFAFQRWSTFRGTALAAIFLWLLPSILGIIGLWVNRDCFARER